MVHIKKIKNKVHMSKMVDIYTLLSVYQIFAICHFASKFYSEGYCLHFTNELLILICALYDTLLFPRASFCL